MSVKLGETLVIRVAAAMERYDFTLDIEARRTRPYYIIIIRLAVHSTAPSHHNRAAKPNGAGPRLDLRSFVPRDGGDPWANHHSLTS